jgi:outer membrane protein
MQKNKLFIPVLTLLIGSYVSAQKKYTLQECVELAVEKNISIKQSQLDVQNAEITKSDAFGNFLPNINASASHSWNVGLNQNITTGILENTTTQFTSMGGSLNVDVFKGFQNVNQMYRANLNLLAQQYKLADMTDDIMLFVANAYLQVMFNRELYQVQQQQIQITKTDLERTQAQIDAGVLVANEIYELEANLATQEQELIRLENTLRLSKISLAQQLLITDYENFDIATEDFEVPFSEILSKNPKEIFEKSMTFRNDIKLSETNIAIAEKDLAIAKGTLQPSLRAFYSYSTRISYSDRLVAGDGFTESPIGYVGETGQIVNTMRPNTKVIGPKSFQDQFSLNEGQNYGLSLSIPIFNRNTASNQVKRSKVNLLRNENLLEQQKLELETAVNQAYNDTRGAFTFYEAAQKTAYAREQAFLVAQNRYENGVLNTFDFVQSKQRYETALSDEIRAKYDYIFKLKVLEFYFGVPIEMN